MHAIGWPVAECKSAAAGTVSTVQVVAAFTDGTASTEVPRAACTAVGGGIATASAATQTAQADGAGHAQTIGVPVGTETHLVVVTGTHSTQATPAQRRPYEGERGDALTKQGVHLATAAGQARQCAGVAFVEPSALWRRAVHTQLLGDDAPHVRRQLVQRSWFIHSLHSILVSHVAAENVRNAFIYPLLLARQSLATPVSRKLALAQHQPPPRSNFDATARAVDRSTHANVVARPVGFAVF